MNINEVKEAKLVGEFILRTDDKNKINFETPAPSK